MTTVTMAYQSLLEEMRRNYRPHANPHSQQAGHLFFGRGRCFPGLEFINIEQINNVLLIKTYLPTSLSVLAPLLELLSENFAHQFPNIVWKQQDQRGQVTVLRGLVPEPLLANENDLRFQLNIFEHQNIGLFFDMRPGRMLVEKLAAGKKVLNLFAYTCAFSVYATRGGATKIVNLDLNKHALAIGRENHRLNKLAGPQVQFYAHNVMTSLNTHLKRESFDLVIIDPPSLQKGSFDFRRDYPKILRKLNSWQPTGSELLACLNFPGFTVAEFRGLLQEHAPRLEIIQQVPVAAEIRELPGSGALKVFHCQFAEHS